MTLNERYLATTIHALAKYISHTSRVHPLCDNDGLPLNGQKSFTTTIIEKRYEKANLW